MNSLHQHQKPKQRPSYNRLPFSIKRPSFFTSKDFRPAVRKHPKKASLSKYLRPPPLSKFGSSNHDQKASHLTNVPVNTKPKNYVSKPFHRENQNTKYSPDPYISHNVIPQPLSLKKKPQSIFFHPPNVIPFTAASIPTANSQLRTPFYPTKLPKIKPKQSLRQTLFSGDLFSLSPKKRKNLPKWATKSFSPFKLPLYTPPRFLSRNKKPIKSHFKVFPDGGSSKNQANFNTYTTNAFNQEHVPPQYRNAVDPHASESGRLSTSYKNQVKKEKRTMSQPLPKEIMQGRGKKMPESHRSMLKSLKYGINGEPLDVWIPIRSQEEEDRS